MKKSKLATLIIVSGFWLLMSIWHRAVLVGHCTGNKGIQNGGQSKIIGEIVSVFMDILHSLAFLRLLLIDREYDSIFDVDQQNFSKRFYLGINIFLNPFQ